MPDRCDVCGRYTATLRDIAATDGTVHVGPCCDSPRYEHPQRPGLSWQDRRDFPLDGDPTVRVNEIGGAA